MVLSMAMFAVEDTFLKLAARELPISQVQILVGLMGATIFGLWARRAGYRILSSAYLKPRLILRNFFELAGTAIMTTALMLMPLATVSAIQQAAPLLMTMGAALFLGAPVGWRRWSAVGVGFVGMLVIVRPGAESFQPAAILAVIGTFMLAGRDLVTRTLPPDLPSPVIGTWGCAAIAAAGLAMTPFWPAPVLPSAGGALRICGAFCFLIAGYYSLTRATRDGDIAAIAPFRYSRLVFAMIMGLAVFGEIPDGWTLAGAALILGSGFYTLARERRARRRPLSSAAQAG